MSYDLLIKNGDVVLPDEVKRLNIGIKNGKIADLGDVLSNQAKQTIDAEGMTVFPGMIDVHVHFDEPGRENWEGFETGSAMLAAGGCTTFFDMPLNGIPSTVTQAAFVDKVAIGEAKSHIDFGLWGGLVPEHLNDLNDLAGAGAIGFKAFLSPSGNPYFHSVDDASLLEGMKRIARTGAVLALHSESAPLVTFLQKEKESEGLTGYDDYAASRPVQAETEAVSRALTFAEVTGCPLHFVHISTVKAVALIQAAKKRGQDVTLETCPHYLLYNHQDFCKAGVVGKCAPPLRSEAERSGLVDLLLQGRIDMISSDHSPCEWKDKQAENIFSAWGGISGGQFSLLSAIEIALTHHLPLTKVADWTAKRPAERFRLAAQKGTIREGADADLAIVALDKPERVTKDKLYQKNKFSLYEGHTFSSSIQLTINRGNIVYSKADGINGAAAGKWLCPEK
ncbi:allantoinase [Sporolactobacillus shoreicorticis]|uniref:Allantoinase n=1 Tax=Sporolactobacillus shoreicorticis TaxID=1923877 RepID=A0ABW5S8F7_9BACL|nr:allantoinase [Sporolactobacillus shoreicorticis]MCO7126944.1 allantoinase [Sporolactobacillus shoreicorticis]